MRQDENSKRFDLEDRVFFKLEMRSAKYETIPNAPGRKFETI